MQEVLSFRIPKKLKKKMKKYDINWKEYLIAAIEEKIKQIESERVLNELDKMNRGMVKAPKPSWKMIREDRDEGH